MFLLRHEDDYFSQNEISVKNLIIFVLFIHNIPSYRHNDTLLIVDSILRVRNGEWPFDLRLESRWSSSFSWTEPQKNIHSSRLLMLFPNILWKDYSEQLVRISQSLQECHFILDSPEDNQLLVECDSPSAILNRELLKCWFIYSSRENQSWRLIEAQNLFEKLKALNNKLFNFEYRKSFPWNRTGLIEFAVMST